MLQIPARGTPDSKGTPANRAPDKASQDKGITRARVNRDKVNQDKVNRAANNRASFLAAGNLVRAADSPAKVVDKASPVRQVNEEEPTASLVKPATVEAKAASRLRSSEPGVDGVTIRRSPVAPGRGDGAGAGNAATVVL